MKLEREGLVLEKDQGEWQGGGRWAGAGDIIIYEGEEGAPPPTTPVGVGSKRGHDVAQEAVQWYARVAGCWLPAGGRRDRRGS